MRSYRVKITIRARQKGEFLRKKIFVENNRVVLLDSKVMILLLLVLFPDDRNFLFHPTTQTNLILFMHIIHHKITKVIVRNISD